MNTLRLTKANALIKASYQLSLNELRIVLYGLSHINPTIKEFPLFHEVNMKEMASFYQVSSKDMRGFYQNIREALLSRFWEREFSYYDSKKEAVVKARWLIQVEYSAKNGKLACYYNPLIKDQLQQLASRFTSYSLCNIADMKSVYGIRLYEIAIMNFNTVKKEVMDFTENLQELKHILGIKDKYKNFHDFKRRVLDSAQIDINNYSDIKMSWRPVKQGRKVTHIHIAVAKEATKSYSVLAAPCHIATKVIEQAKKIVIDSGTKWDVYRILDEFFEYARVKGTPINPAGAFLNFTKKKVLQRP